MADSKALDESKMGAVKNKDYWINKIGVANQIRQKLNYSEANVLITDSDLAIQKMLTKTISENFKSKAYDKIYVEGSEKMKS